MIQRDPYITEVQPIRLRQADLGPYLLLKNGNDLYRIPYHGGWAVLKVYYGSRSRFQYWSKTCSNVLFANQTSFTPAARRRTELECLELWRSHGFRVFNVYHDVQIEDVPEHGYAVYEYVPGLKFVDLFSDASVPVEEKLAWWRRFLPVWHRRHQLCHRPTNLGSNRHGYLGSTHHVSVNSQTDN